MNHTFRIVITLLLAAFTVASCDKLKPPLRLPLPQTDPRSPTEQAPAPKQRDPGASGVRALANISHERVVT
jgi:hypothetical protein